MIQVAREKSAELLKAVAPLIVTICVLQLTLVHAPLELFLRFLFGSFLAVIGMMLLFVGIDVGIVPMGRDEVKRSGTSMGI